MGTSDGLTVNIAKQVLRNNFLKSPLIISPELIRHLEEMRLINAQIQEAHRKHFEHFQNLTKDLQEGFKRFEENFNPSLIKLSDQGWYICGYSAIGDSIYLSKELEKGDIKKVDLFLINFYETEFNSIIRNIKRQHPSSSKIVHEAQKAHKLKMYYASTSLFISTADGIFDGCLFTLKKGKKELKSKLRKFKHQSSFGELLTKISPIDAPDGKVKNYKSSLNRHGVMHGRDYEYGSKINSLKALSLLAFICDFFDEKESQ